MYSTAPFSAEAIRRENSLLHAVLGHAIYMLDATGVVSTWNAGASKIIGYTSEEAIGVHYSRLCTAEDRKNGEPERRLRLAGELGHYECESWRPRKDGSCFWASIAIDPIYEEGALAGFVEVMRDVSCRHLATEQLIGANHDLEIALTHMSLGLALFDSTGKLILANRRLNEMFGVPEGRLRIGISATKAIEALGFSRSRSKHLYGQFESLPEREGRYRALQETGSGRLMSIAIQRTPESCSVMTFEDVTERLTAELQLEHLASRDPLTGLANRTFFRRRLEEAVARMKRGVPFALLLVDIRDFSSINELLGEAAGDEILKSIAQTIKQQVRDVDTLARLDGDEFAILQCNPEEPKDTEVLAARLMECFSTPSRIDDQAVMTSVNIGIALGASDGADSHELLKNADLALRRAKQSVLPCYSFFNAEIDSHLKTRRALENDLYEAVRREEFSLHYQPIADAQTGRISGFEALLRWQHPTRGWISPAEFVPVAEECGLIVAIGAWVLRTACAQATAWPAEWHVAVNLSPLQFQENLLPATVSNALETTGLNPRRLELEVTESVLLRDDEVNLSILSRLRAMGVHISLDDFGIGYSSLAYLRSFRFDKLKIDRSFIQDLPQDGPAKSIVNAVAGLGKNFGIAVVAEGVETQEQLDYLRQLGCDEVQGYLLGMPLPPEELWGAQVEVGSSLREDSSRARPVPQRS